MQLQHMIDTQIQKTGQALHTLTRLRNQADISKQKKKNKVIQKNNIETQGINNIKYQNHQGQKEETQIGIPITINSLT